MSCYTLIVPNDNGTQHSLVQRIAGQRIRLIFLYRYCANSVIEKSQDSRLNYYPHMI
nr:MAG TPA: hypothetical protein [Caudoviricetes sp.]